jgi:hypothetical protein
LNKQIIIFDYFHKNFKNISKERSNKDVCVNDLRIVLISCVIMDGWYFSKVDMLIVNPIINIEGVKVRVGEKRYSFLDATTNREEEVEEEEEWRLIQFKLIS